MSFLIRSTEPGRLSIEIQGALDRETVPELRKKILKLARKADVNKFEVDFGHVSGMDTSGIALMVEILRIMKRRNGEVRLSGLNERTLQMIRLARLDRIFQLNDHTSSRT